MDHNSNIYLTYADILKIELKKAMGCTEPIALAYCAAMASKVLGEKPQEIKILASGNIIKNVKSVVVPNTNGLKGLEAAAVVGILYGDENQKLEVISKVTNEQAASIKEQMATFKISVEPLNSEHVLDMVVELKGENHQSLVQIQDQHTNIVKILKDGEEISFENKQIVEMAKPNYDLLTIEDIYDFANSVDLNDVRDVISTQIACNMAISEAGLKQKYGAAIGKTLLASANDVKAKARAYAAAASDARMGGCELPVVINSGSGNQGITTSIPVVIYAREYGKSEEELYRALVLANLVTLHLKSGIGRLSAYCGAVSAGVGAGAGIAYLLTKDLRIINHTIVNAIAINSGIVCDGAKASCAAKISMAVEAGIMGFEMIQAGNQFYAGEGLVEKGVENTIRNISRLGHDGMVETDKTIIEIMTSNKK